MSNFGRKFDEALDKHITGNYGEDQFHEEEYEREQAMNECNWCGNNIKEEDSIKWNGVYFCSSKCLDECRASRKRIAMKMDIHYDYKTMNFYKGIWYEKDLEILNQLLYGNHLEDKDIEKAIRLLYAMDLNLRGRVGYNKISDRVFK